MLSKKTTNIADDRQRYGPNRSCVEHLCYKIGHPGIGRESVYSLLKVRVRINRKVWTRIKSLDSAGPHDKVYSVRQNKDGRTTIKFGDGVHGELPPPGKINIIATYKYGAGSNNNNDKVYITSLKSTLRNLGPIRNPGLAEGGDDVDEENNRRNDSF